MIRCLLDNNDTVVDKFLSESVLEMEYLEQKVATLIVTCDYNQMNGQGAVRHRLQAGVPLPPGAEAVARGAAVLGPGPRPGQRHLLPRQSEVGWRLRIFSNSKYLQCSGYHGPSQR